ncbi:hypothetical protein GCM10022419_126200 [Nonomuraea rosea]|uniref:Uncharacterized protein n=1 Tax=Nonomuraea rosea TaxID=638574 RepID=A0ABP6ZU83_9ACTN
MRTYQELFRTPELTPLFAASCAQVASTTLLSVADRVRPRAALTLTALAGGVAGLGRDGGGVARSHCHAHPRPAPVERDPAAQTTTGHCASSA